MKNDSATSRLVQKLVDDEIRFAVINGCRLGAESTRNLHNDIRALGFKYNQFISRWTEDGNPREEYSLLVPNISLKKAIILGQTNECSAIIYKDKNGCKIYCTTPFDPYNAGDVIMSFKIDKENPLNAETAAKIFSGKRQEVANFETAETFKLSERVLVSTFYGFTEEEVDLMKLDKTLNDDFKKSTVREVGTKGAYNGYRYLLNDIQYDKLRILQSDYSSYERSELIDESEEHGIIVLPEGSVEKEDFLEFMNSLDNKYCEHMAIGFFLKSGTHYNRNNAFTENSLSVEVIGLNSKFLINLCERIIQDLSINMVILKTEPSHSLFFIE